MALRDEALGPLRPPHSSKRSRRSAAPDALITHSGRDEMARLTDAIARAGQRVDKLARAACEAEAFAQSAEEKRAL